MSLKDEMIREKIEEDYERAHCSECEKAKKRGLSLCDIHRDKLMADKERIRELFKKL